jgi:Zn-dependent protease
MDFLLYLAGFWFFLVLVGRFSQWKLLFTLRLQVPVAHLVEQSDIPESVSQQLKTGIEEVLKLGMQYSHSYQSNSMVVNVDKGWHIVFAHPQHQCFCEIVSTDQPNGLFPYKVYFYSFLDNHQVCYTLNHEIYGMIANMDGFICNDAFAESLPQIKDSHLQVVERTVSSSRSNTKPLLLSPNEYIEAHNLLYDKYFTFLQASGKIIADSNLYKLSLKTVFPLSEKMIKGTNKLAKVVNKAAEDEPKNSIVPTNVEHEVQSYYQREKLLDSSKLNGFGKTALFIVSALAFAVVFGVTFTPSLLLVLIAVLLFHEMGHIFAMWLCGYRDLQILFIPFMGALAAGKKVEPTALQKAFVSLMGPIPGLVLALILIVAFPEVDSIWLNQAIVMLLIINFLNLLPVMPFDGGQFMNTMLFDRFPRAQFIFLIISFVILAVSAYYFRDPILTIVAGFIGFSLIAEYRQSTLLIQLLKVKPKSPDKSQLLHKIFEAVAKPPYNGLLFIQKYELVNQLYTRLEHKLPKPIETIMALIVYCMVIGSPVYIIDRTLLNGVLFSEALISAYDADWDKQINLAETDVDKLMLTLSAAIYYLELEDLTQAQGYYQKALKLSSSTAELAAFQPVIQLGATLAKGMETDLSRQIEVLQKQDVINPNIPYTIYRLAYHLENNSSYSSYAEPLYHVAKQHFINTASTEGLFQVNTALSRLYESAGDNSSAEKLLVQNIEYVEHDRYSLFDAKNILAEFYFRQQNHTKADQVWRSALNNGLTAEEEPFTYQEIYSNLVWNSFISQDSTQTIGYLKNYIQLLKHINNKNDDQFLHNWIGENLFNTHLDLMAVYFADNQIEQAQEALEKAKMILEQDGNSWSDYRALYKDVTDQPQISKDGILVFKAFYINKALAVLD